MSEINLICNYKKCRVILNTYAWVTSCSHVFCDSHGSQIFNQEKKCLCCNEVLCRNLDISQINLNPDESYKSVCNIDHCIKKISATTGSIWGGLRMILCGLRPEIVMDISLRAVSFWNYQMAQEKLIQTSNTKHLQEKLEQIKINTKAKERQFQKYILIEMKKAESALKDAELQRRKTLEIEEKLMEKNRILHQVQSKCESLKLQLISTTIKSTKSEQESKPLKSHKDFVFAPNLN